jgi:hypothetical protein
MFVKILTEISNQVGDEIERRYNRLSSNINFETKLYYAITIWSFRLNIPENITQYIIRGCKLYEVRELTNFIWQEGTTENKLWRIPTPVGEEPRFLRTENKLYQHIKSFFNLMHLRSNDMQIIVLIAFVVTAVGYFVYLLNRQQQQQSTRREEPRQYNSNPSSFTAQTSTVPAPPIQRITKQFLVLVVSASQADFLESLKSKGRINVNDGEELYEMTKYLWLGSETDFNQKRANINQYSISKGQESEYDIYLIYIELNQADEGLKSNVNQLDRYDAFRNLDNLAVSLSISPRLQMEAYGKFDVYSR